MYYISYIFRDMWKLLTPEEGKAMLLFRRLLSSHEYYNDKFYKYQNKNFIVIALFDSVEQYLWRTWNSRLDSLGMYEGCPKKALLLLFKWHSCKSLFFVSKWFLAEFF